ncbi:hypothetical protein [Paraburkholderia nodosa]|nr:hypothetical protein [Paraburkholderia nodosa]
MTLIDFKERAEAALAGSEVVFEPVPDVMAAKEAAFSWHEIHPMDDRRHI